MNHSSNKKAEIRIHTELPEKDKKKYILWDMDGVLINSEGQHYRAWKRVFKALFGLEDVDYDLYKSCIGCRFTVIQGIMQEHYGLDIDTPEVRARNEQEKRAIEAEEGFLATEGISETIHELKKRGYVMAVASSSPQPYIERVVKAIGIEDCFTVLLSGEQVKNSKPAPDTFLVAAEMLGASPDECVVVEDSFNGSTAAKAAGMYCIGYDNPDSGEQNLEKADVIIDYMPDVLEML